MKKVITIVAVAFMLFAGTTQAQKGNLSVNLGYAPQTFSSVTTIMGNDTKSSTNYTGFFAGINYTNRLSSNLGLNIGVQGRYNYKTEENSLATIKNTQFLIDVPVMLSFGIQLGNDARLSCFAGPAISFALQGKTVTTGKISSNDYDYEWYDNDEDIEHQQYRFDLSAVAGLAFQFRTLRIFGGYRQGFLDQAKPEAIKTTTNGLFAGLGIML